MLSQTCGVSFVARVEAVHEGDADEDLRGLAVLRRGEDHILLDARLVDGEHPRPRAHQRHLRSQGGTSPGLANAGRRSGRVRQLRYVYLVIPPDKIGAYGSVLRVILGQHLAEALRVGAEIETALPGAVVAIHAGLGAVARGLPQMGEPDRQLAVPDIFPAQ